MAFRIRRLHYIGQAIEISQGEISVRRLQGVDLAATREAGVLVSLAVAKPT